MAKEKAVATQLKEAKAEIERLTKELTSEKSSLKYAQTARDEAKKELEGIHSALDCVPNAPPRKTESESFYGKIDVPASSRLFAWVANVAFKGVKTTTKIEEEE